MRYQQEQGGDGRAAAGRPGLGPLALLLLLAALPFLPALTGGLVYDDLLLPERHAGLRGVADLPGILTTGYWDFAGSGLEGQVGHWRPLTSLVLGLGHLAGGGATWVHHLVSLLLHLLAAYVATSLALALTDRRGVALWTGLLFALHPVHVESVAWISALGDPLSGLLVLLGLRAHLLWRRAGSPGVPWRSGLWLLLGLLAKETALAGVLLALALDLGRGIGSRGWRVALTGLRPLVRGYLGYGVALLLYLGGRVAVFGDLSAGLARPATEFGFPFLRGAVLPFEVFGDFLALLAWPLRLAVFRPIRPALGAALLISLACGLAWAVLLLWRGRRRDGVVAGALLVIPAGLAPVLLLTGSLGAFIVSDRYLYLPVVGFALALALAVVRHLPRRAAVVVLALVAALYGARSGVRSTTWRGQEVFLRTAIADTPESPYPWWGLGRHLLEEYRARGGKERLDEARRCYVTSSELVARATGKGELFATTEDLVQTEVGMAWCTLFAGEERSGRNVADALRRFLDLTKRFPREPHVWAGAGTALVLSGRKAEAEAAWRKALTLAPGDRQTRHNLARLLTRRGITRAAARDAAAAARLFAEALRVHPGYGPAHTGQGKLHLAVNQPEKALASFREACRLGPDDFDAHYNAGTLLLRRRDPAARSYLQRALDLLPGWPGRPEIRGRLQAELERVLRKP